MVKIWWSKLASFLTDPPVWQTDRRTNGQTELRWLRRAETIAAFARKNLSGFLGIYPRQSVSTLQRHKTMSDLLSYWIMLLWTHPYIRKFLCFGVSQFLTHTGQQLPHFSHRHEGTTILVIEVKQFTEFCFLHWLPSDVLDQLVSAGPRLHLWHTRHDIL